MRISLDRKKFVQSYFSKTLTPQLSSLLHCHISAETNAEIFWKNIRNSRPLISSEQPLLMGKYC